MQALATPDNKPLTIGHVGFVSRPDRAFKDPFAALNRPLKGEPDFKRLYQLLRRLAAEALESPDAEDRLAEYLEQTNDEGGPV